MLDADLAEADEAAIAAAPGSRGRARHRRPPTGSGTPSWCCRSRRWRRRTAPTSTATAGSSATSRPSRQPGMARPAWWVAGEVLAGPGPERRRPGHGGRGVRAAGRALAGRSPGSPTATWATPAGCWTAPGSRRRRAGAGGGAMTPEMKGFLLLSIIKMLVVFTVIMVGVALLTLMERKVSAWMQNRRGPNRVGPGRPAAARGRRAQEHPQGRDLPGAGQPVALPAGAGAVLHPGAAALRGDSRSARRCRWTSTSPSGRCRPVRPPRPHADGRGRPAGRIPLRPGHQLDGGVRHRAGGLVVQQQVRAARRAPGQRADGLLRGRRWG